MSYKSKFYILPNVVFPYIPVTALCYHYVLYVCTLQVTIFSYQCSRLSTPESVIEVFNNASKFQGKQDIASSVAVVVLDEVGLAEDSPNLPLKALHPLLEDGTEGAKEDYTDQVRNSIFNHGG